MSVEAQDGQEIELKITKQKVVTKDKIKIKFLSVVEDSRCPEGVNCIWAGNAKIKIEVSQKNQKEIFDINTNLGEKGVSFKDYAINLEKLTPAPKKGQAS